MQTKRDRLNTVSTLDVYQILNSSKEQEIFCAKLTKNQYTLGEERHLLESLETLLLQEGLTIRAEALKMASDLYTLTSKPHKDIKKGLRYLREATELNNVTSSGLDKECAVTLRQLESDVAKNNPLAMHDLGLMYFKGSGVPQNVVKAALLFRNASILKQEHSETMLTLLKEKYTTNYSVQYHCVMALAPHTIQALYKKSPHIISECIINDTLLAKTQKQQLFIDTIFQYDSEKALSYDLSSEVNHFIDEAFMAQAIYCSLNTEANSETSSHIISNFTCTFQNNKLLITSEDGIEEKLTISQIDKEAILRCNTLPGLIKILRLHEIKFGNQVANSIEPYLDTIPTELAILNQINQQYYDKKDTKYLQCIKAMRLLERYIDQIDVTLLQESIDHLPWMIEHFDSFIRNALHLPSNRYQDVLDVIIKLASLEQGGWIRTHLKDIIHELKWFNRDSDFQTVFIKTLFKLCKVQHSQKIIEQINALESNEYTIAIAAAIAQLASRPYAYLTGNFFMLKKIIENPKHASNLYTLFVRFGAYLTDALLKEILQQEVLNNLNTLIGIYSINKLVLAMDTFKTDSKEQESLGFPLTPTMMDTLDDKHLIELKEVLHSIYETNEVYFTLRFNIYSRLTGPDLQLLVKKIGQNYIKETICQSPDKLFATLKQMTFDCQKVLYDTLGSEEISKLFFSSNATLYYLQQISIEEFSFLLDFIDIVKLTKKASLSGNTSMIYKLLARIEQVNAELLNKILHNVGLNWLRDTNKTLETLQDNLSKFDTAIGKLTPFNELYKKIPSEDYRLFYGNFNALCKDLTHYTPDQFSMVLEKLGTSHLKKFIKDALLDGPKLPPELQCLFVEALGIKKFIQSALENPEDEERFWNEFSHKQYSANEEQYLVLCLEEELALLQDPSEKKGCALGMIGVLFAFTTHAHKEVQKGLMHMEAAAFLNNSNAMNNLGYIYEGNRGVVQDFPKALEFFKQAASLKNANAINNLGRMYEEGKGTPQDYALAFEYYQQSVLLNHTFSMCNLAKMYCYGIGVSVNQTEAAMLYRKAHALSCSYSTSFTESKNMLHNLKKAHPNDSSVQYHCVMALEPQNIKALLDTSREFIRDCILYDSLLTDKQKYQPFSDYKLAIKPLLDISPKSIGECILRDPFIQDKEKYLLFADSNLDEALFYDLLVDYAQHNGEEAQEFCQEAVNYLLEANESGKQYNNALANCLYYCMALQYDAAGDYKEAIKYCLKTKDYIPAHHLLAHLLFINKCGMPEMQRYLLCLLWLKEETTLPTINVRAALICKVLNLLQERKEYDSLAKVNQKEQIDSLLKGKYTPIFEAYACLNEWEERVNLLAHKQMLFFSANTLPDEAQKRIKENYLQVNGL